nr:collagen alpha-2(I) chain-like [Manis javanica]
MSRAGLRDPRARFCRAGRGLRECFRVPACRGRSVWIPPAPRRSLRLTSASGGAAGREAVPGGAAGAGLRVGRGPGAGLGRCLGEGAAAPEPAATWSRGARVRVPANVRSRPGPRGRGRSSAQGGPGRLEGVRSGPGRGSERRRGSGAGPRGAGPDCLGDEQRRPPPRCGADPGLDPLRGHSGEAQRPRPAGKAEPQGEPQHRRWGAAQSWAFRNGSLGNPTAPLPGKPSSSTKSTLRRHFLTQVCVRLRRPWEVRALSRTPSTDSHDLFMFVVGDLHSWPAGLPPARPDDQEIFL